MLSRALTRISASYCFTFPLLTFYAVKALKFNGWYTRHWKLEDKCDTVLVIMKKGFERRFCADADCICQFNFFALVLILCKTTFLVHTTVAKGFPSLGLG